MVKLSVRYDKKLGSNVFVVRDDETYVSSTKTILTVSPEYFPTIEGVINHLWYRVDLEINVLRETGDSTVVIYDGENVLDVKEWHGVPLHTHYDFAVGTHHTLKAIFMGNKNCLKSHSKSYDVFMESTEYDANLEYDGNSVIKNTTSFTFNVFELDESTTPPTRIPIDEGAVTVSYTDGVHNGIVSDVDVEDGSVTVDFGADFGNIPYGLFDISVRYNGAAHYNPAILGFKVSKYFKVNLEGYYEYRPNNGAITRDSRWLLGEDYTLVGTLTDFMGNPYHDSETVSIYGYNTGTWELIADGYVDVNGKFQTTLLASNYQGAIYTKFRFGVGNIYGEFDHFNPVLEPNIIDITDIRITSIGLVQDEYKFYADVYGYSKEEIESRISGLPVKIWCNPPVAIQTYVTNSQGRATCAYWKGFFEPGDTTIYVRCGDFSTTYSVQNYIIDYVAPTWKGIDLSLRNTTKQALQTGMKYTAKASGGSAIYLPTPTDYKNNSLRFTFTVVDTSNDYFYYGLIGDNGQLYLTGYPDSNWLGVGDTAEYYIDATNNEVVCTAKGRERFRYDTSNGKYYPAIVYVPVGTQSDGYVVLNNIRYEAVK